MYNRYVNHSQYRPVAETSPNSSVQRSSNSSPRRENRQHQGGNSSPRRENKQSHDCNNSPRRENRQHQGGNNPSNKDKGREDSIFGFFKNFLPKDLDIGDILLFLILFLAYKDSGDEEFLIILIALIFMTFN